MTSQEDRRTVVFGSFDSAETAKLTTGGKVYAVKGHEDHAIILEDQSGRNWLYVKPDSDRYRDICNQAWGHRMSEDGKDADHIASRGIESRIGQGYVLMGAVDSSANRSHGSFEKPGRHLDRPFNAASMGKAHVTDPDQTAIPLSYRQSHKTHGMTKKQLAENKAERLKGPGIGVGDADFDTATFGDPKHQAELEKMKGEELHFPEKTRQKPETYQTITEPMPWDKRQAELDVKNTSPGPKTRS